MIEATLSASTLKKVIEAVRELLGDAVFECDDSGITMQAMDSSHVSLCALHFGTELFKRYHCDKPISLGLNTPSLAKILKCAGYEDNITIKGEEGSGYLTMTFETPNRHKKSEFEVMLMDIESEHLSIPETDYLCRVRLPSAELQRIIRDLKELGGSLGDACTISVEKGSIKFSCLGPLGSGSIVLQHNTTVSAEEDTIAVNVHADEHVEHSFAVRYLSIFTKATPLDPTVTLYLSPDVPMMLEYPIERAGYLRFYLAPKVDED